MSISPSYVDGLELRIKELGEQVENLKAELASIDGALNDPRANLTLTTSEIIWKMKEQVENLTKERDDLTKTLELMEHTRDTEQIRHREMMSEKREQLAALAEQNEKYREALQKLACLGNGEQYGNSIGNCIAQEALSLPGLASPVLNRIRAEALYQAAKWFNDNVDNRTDQAEVREQCGADYACFITHIVSS